MGTSGPLDPGGNSGKLSAAPNLAQYSSEPKYDLATIVQAVGVRPMILWGWETQLGIPAPVRLTDDASGNVRRYSERDLIASIWLRDQILNGVAPTEAASALLAVQPTSGSGIDHAGQGDEQLNAPKTTNPLAGGDFRPVRTAAQTRPLQGADRLVVADSFFNSPSYTSPSASGRLTGRPAPGSGALPPRVTAVPVSGPLSASYGAPPSSGTLGVQPDESVSAISYGPRPPIVSRPRNLSAPLSSSIGGMSGPLAGVTRGVASGVLSRHDAGGAESGFGNVAWPVPGVGTSATSGPAPRGRDIRQLVPPLIRAFTNLDTSTANHILNEAVSVRSVESVCMSLLQPALGRVMELWSRHEMTAPECQFAANYVRAHLYSIFHRTPERTDGPLVFICCGPKEQNDVGALMLAAFWRRAGLRVIYLGLDVETRSLIDELRVRRPGLLAVCISTPQRVRSLARLAKTVAQLDGPRPVFGYYGSVFLRNPELQRKIEGVYLGDDAATATFHATNLLGATH